MKISAICPTYKRPDLLRNAVACWEAQDYPADECELLIFDDAGQFEDCEGENWRLISTPDRVPILWEKFNQAIDQTTGDIIVIWEDDDIYLPNHLSEIAKVAEQAPALIMPDSVYSGKQNSEYKITPIRRLSHHSAWAFSRESWEAIGRYPNDVNQLQGCTILAENMHKLAEPTYYKGPTHVYRWNPTPGHLHVSSRGRDGFLKHWEKMGNQPAPPQGVLVPQFDEETLNFFSKIKANETSVSQSLNPSIPQSQMSLSLGFCTRDDSDGAYFTIESFLAHHADALQMVGSWEIIVVDNSPEGSPHVVALQNYLKGYPNLKYIRATGEPSSCIYKDQAIAAATGDIYIGCDSHVIFDAGSIAKVVAHFKANPESRDLIMGPCFKRHDQIIGTNQQLYASENYKVPANAQVVDGVVWRGGSAGVWVHDQRAYDPNGEPFEIQQQGTGAFACMRKAWPGFDKSFKGFGGNETYLMEKIRSNGGRVLCHPGFRWIHRFMRSHAPYPVHWEDRVRNYLTSATKLNRPDLYNSAVAHFEKVCPKTTAKILGSIPKPLGSGPGTELVEIFKVKGFPACQACYHLARRMNEWGVAGCRENMNAIIDDIVPRAKSWLGKEKPWAKALLGSVALEDFALKKAIKPHILQAIAAAESKTSLNSQP